MVGECQLGTHRPTRARRCYVGAGDAGDREFGQWLRSSNLEEGVHPADQSAAMWAAANQDNFDTARAAGNARTVRGIHAKWLVTYNLQVTGGDAANIRAAE